MNTIEASANRLTVGLFEPYPSPPLEIWPLLDVQHQPLSAHRKLAAVVN